MQFSQHQDEHSQLHINLMLGTCYHHVDVRPQIINHSRPVTNFTMATSDQQLGAEALLHWSFLAIGPGWRSTQRRLNLLPEPSRSDMPSWWLDL